MYGALVGPVFDLHIDMVGQSQPVDEVEEVVVKEKTPVEQTTMVVKEKMSVEHKTMVEQKTVVVEQKTEVEVAIVVVVFQQRVEVVEPRWTSLLQSKCKTSNYHLSIPKKNLLD